MSSPARNGLDCAAGRRRERAHVDRCKHRWPPRDRHHRSRRFGSLHEPCHAAGGAAALPAAHRGLRRELHGARTRYDPLLPRPGLGQATAGVLVDRYGASRLLIGGLTAISAAIAAIGAATHYWMLLPLAVVAGLGNSVFHPADLSILSHLVGKQRLGRAYAVHGLAGSIGFAVSPVLVTAIAGLYSWRAALITVGAIGLSVAAMLYLRRPMLVYNRPEPGCSEGEARRRGSYRNVIGSPIVLLAFAYFALTAFAGSGVQTFGVSALKEGYGMALQLATLALACYLVGSSCGVFVGGFLADRTEQHHRVAMSGIAT